MSAKNQLTLTVGVLQGALDKVKHALPAANCGMPTLRSVRLETTASGTGISATDLNVGIRVTVPAAVELTSPIILSSEKLLGYVKLLDGEDVTISTTAKSDGRATLTCGEIRGGIPCFAGTDGFVLPTGDKTIEIEQSILRRMLGFVAFAVPTDDSRYTLQGIQLEATGKELLLVATDGHRISIYTVPFETDTALTLLIPASLVRVLMATLDDSDGTVRIESTPDALGITVTGEHLIEMRSQRMSGQFPAWRAIMPESHPNSFDLAVGPIHRAFLRCILMADSRSQCVDMRFNKNTLSMRGASTETGESEDKVQLSTEIPEPLRIGICGGYVVDILKRIPDEIRINVGTEKDVVLFMAEPVKGETLRYGVMPMRV
jgi:DNA polymerase-3 subunit beta